MSLTGTCSKKFGLFFEIVRSRSQKKLRAFVTESSKMDDPRPGIADWHTVVRDMLCTDPPPSQILKRGAKKVETSLTRIHGYCLVSSPSNAFHSIIVMHRWCN